MKLENDVVTLTKSEFLFITGAAIGVVAFTARQGMIDAPELYKKLRRDYDKMRTMVESIEDEIIKTTDNSILQAEYLQLRGDK